MINMYEVSETNKMIEQENLDVRTITLGISLLDCIDSNLDELNRKIYEKITTVAKDLVSTGQDIEKEFGILTLDKRIAEALQKHKLNIKKEIDEIKRQKAAQNVYGKQFEDIYFLNKQI